MNCICNHQSEFLHDRQKLFTVAVRSPGGEWLPVSLCNARVGLRRTGQVSIGSFDFTGTVEVSVSFKEPVRSWVVRPLHHPVAVKPAGPRTVTFILDRPRKLAIEVDGDRLNNLHLFANAPQEAVADDPGVISFSAGIHHVGEDGWLRLKSGQTLHLAYGAILKTRGIICDHVEDVRITGRGIVDLSEWMPVETFDRQRPDTRGVCVTFSRNIRIDGLLFLNPNHYTLYLGQSDQITVRNIKTFSSSLWADGIDCMSTTRLEVDDVFLRTSDDCIAIYGRRWDFYGDTRDVTVRNSVLWADVAHPVMIGTHGWHENNGDTVEDIVVENIDILLHDEFIEQYRGALAVNAGDENVIRHILFSDIRIEEIRDGQIFNIRVFKNDDYNPKPGRMIGDVTLRDITYTGPEKPSEISGYAPDRRVQGVHIQGLAVNGRKITSASEGRIHVGEHVEGVTFA